jgi:glycosyltransferase involved in cell wall biosynthesis
MEAGPLNDDITVHVASWNTASATELCIRTMRRHAGHPYALVVGDGGSTDGSLAMLRDFAQRGWLELEVRAGRSHADWLDAWRREARSRYLVFADSDMDFRRPGWLIGLVQRRRETGAALVALDVKPVATGLREPVSARLVRTMPAPTTWLFMIDALQLAGIPESMAPRSVDTENVPEGCILYDTAASFLEHVHDRGLRVATMPPGYQRRVKHYGSLTWMPPAGAAGRWAWDNLAVVDRRLRWVRTLDAADGGLASLWARMVLSPSLEEAVEFVARVRRKAARMRRRPPEDPGGR